MRGGEMVRLRMVTMVGDASSLGFPLVRSVVWVS